VGTVFFYREIAVRKGILSALGVLFESWVWGLKGNLLVKNEFLKR
jgi:hypothetical protein